MHPTLFEIGSFKIPSFGLMVMLGFLAGLWIAAKRARRFGIDPSQVTDISFWVLIAGILGARLGYIIQEIPYYSKHPGELMQWQFAGLTSFGGVIAAVIAVWIACRRKGISTLTFLDVAAPGFLAGHIFGRIGCLLNGCCYGGHCDLPWGIPVDGRAGLYHPAQIYDALMNLAVLGVLFLAERMPLRAGQSIGFALFGHGLARFIYEFWRAGTTSTTMAGLPITEAQVAALLTAIIGAALWVRGARAVQHKSSEAPAP